jgi:Ankyrin repeats (3 copies)
MLDPQHPNDDLQKKRLLELRRLLYCMEHHENMVQETQGQQSWQSILLRAQLLQDKWQALHNTNDFYHPDQRQEYQALSSRVDAACVRAREVASMEKEKEEQKKRLTEFGDQKEDDDDDLVERLFFSTNKRKAGEDMGNDDDRDENTNNEFDDDLDDILEEKEEDDDAAEIFSSNQRRRTLTSNNFNDTTNLQELQEAQREQMEHAISLMAKQMKEATQGIQSRLKQQNETTLNQLESVAEQNVQDVTQVAQNVKDHNIKRSRSNWATWTLLFTLVGIFCFTLMTIFTIPKSPNACLLCIGKKDSLPRRLVAKASHGISLVSVHLKELVSSFRGNDDDYDDEMFQPQDSQQWKDIYDEDERERQEKERLEKLLRNLKNLEKAGASGTAEAVKIDEQQPQDSDHDNPWGIKAEDYVKVEEHQELDNPWGIEAEDDKRIVKDLDAKPDNPWGLESEDDKRHQTKDEKKSDNPWGIEAEDDKPNKRNDHQHDNPWGLESEDDKVSDNAGVKIHHRKQPDTTSDEIQPKHVPPKQVNVDDIFASLKEKMQEAEASTDKIGDQMLHHQDELNASPTAATNEGGFDPTNAFARDGAASERFSPRDFRVKAATNDYDTLKRYISISTEHMNRQDRNGWSALHFATRSGHLQIIELLLEHGADPLLETKDGHTAVQLAQERFEDGHPVRRAFRKAVNEEAPEEDEYTGETDDDEAEKDEEDSDDEEEEDHDEDEEEEEYQVEEEEEKEEEDVDKENQDTLDHTQDHGSFDSVASELPEQPGSFNDSPLKEQPGSNSDDDSIERRRKKMFQPVFDDGDEDIESARSRLDDLLNQPPRKPLFATEDL